MNLADFNILAANFNCANRTFSQGDFNYDGRVNILDFNMLAARFNTTLAQPAPPATGSGVGGGDAFSSRLIDGDTAPQQVAAIDALTALLA